MGDQHNEAIRSFILSMPGKGSRTSSQLTVRLPAGLYVPRLLQDTGLAGFEPSTLACWLTILKLPGPGAAVDVGANVGIYSWLAAAFSERHVVAFEPVPELANALNDVAVENDLQITIEQTALSNQDGRAVLYLSDATDSSNSLVPGFRPSSASLDVTTLRLDTYCSETGVSPHVLKIDTETNEPDVLAGSIQTISTLRPWMIVEVLAGRTEERLTDLLAPFDYYWYPIDENLPLAAASEIVGDPTHSNTNWLFAPTKPQRRFWKRMAKMLKDLQSCTATSSK